MAKVYISVNIFGGETLRFRARMNNFDAIGQMVMRKEVTAQTYVYKVGGNQWVYADKDPEIARLLASMTPPPPPPAM